MLKNDYEVYYMRDARGTTLNLWLDSGTPCNLAERYAYDNENFHHKLFQNAILSEMQDGQTMMIEKNPMSKIAAMEIIKMDARKAIINWDKRNTAQDDAIKKSRPKQ